MKNQRLITPLGSPSGKQIAADAVCRPILFSTPMVNATQAEIKEMTRRTKGLEEINANPNDWQFEWADFALKYPFRFTKLSSLNKKSLADKSFYQAEAKCPYGKVGDILWVRESWNITDPADAVDGEFLGAETGYSGVERDRVIRWRYVYKASSAFEHPKLGKARWKPSIHMPKDACRLFLEITNVRVERLRSIKEIDCLKEGAVPRGATTIGCKDGAFGFFKDLWISINGQSNWELNPWVWVISFKVVECPSGFR